MLRSFPGNSCLQITLAIIAGVLFGIWWPAQAMQLKFFSDYFIQALAWLISPVVFFTAALAFSSMHNVRQLGSLGWKTILCFELFSSAAIIVGLLGTYLLQPGIRIADDSSLHTTVSMLITPSTQNLSSIFKKAFLASTVLHCLSAGVIFGAVLAVMSDKSRKIIGYGENCKTCLHRMVRLLLLFAPLAAFSAITSAVGRHGLISMLPLMKFLAAIYLITFLYVLIIQGLALHYCQIGCLRLVHFLKEELLIVTGIGSSLAVMTRLCEKMKQAGCPAHIVNLAIPTGYSFNLNGSNIYLAMATIFLAQLHQIDLHFLHYLSIFAVISITSKAASGIAGSSFVLLGACITVIPEIPASSVATLYSVERLLKCRSLANLFGNGVACLLISHLSRQIDDTSLRQCQLSLKQA